MPICLLFVDVYHLSPIQSKNMSSRKSKRCKASGSLSVKRVRSGGEFYTVPPPEEYVDAFWRSFWHQIAGLTAPTSPSEIRAFKTFLLREFFKRKRQMDALTGENFWSSLETALGRGDDGYRELGGNRLPASPANRYAASMLDALHDLYVLHGPQRTGHRPLREGLHKAKEVLREWVTGEGWRRLHGTRARTQQALTVPLPDSDPEDDAKDDADDDSMNHPNDLQDGFSESVDSNGGAEDVRFIKSRRIDVSHDQPRKPIRRHRREQPNESFISSESRPGETISPYAGFTLGDARALSSKAGISLDAAIRFLQWWPVSRYARDGSSGPDDNPGYFSGWNPVVVDNAVRAVDARRGLPAFDWLK